LKAWQKSVDLVVHIYEITGRLPKQEIYGLVSQMRRAAVAIPSNISEGASARSVDQFRNYLGIAIGSLNELQTQLEICQRVGYIEKTIFQKSTAYIDECLAITYGLKKSLKS
jgi:four helix bundle protein